MDQQPKIPTLKDSQRPQVKVRGMSIGLTLAERLKQFKKKDLAFILAGLGVLFMAPLAEHFMMAPESADGSLQPGWSGRGGAAGGAPGIFGGGGSPYDRTDGLAPGSPTGGGSDVITPLNVRDPSALVMGPGAAQQPPTNSALPATPPAGSSRSDSDLKDALAASARGIGAAAKKASLPVPKVALGGSGLRGLGVAGGGSSASASLGPISAGNVPNRAAGGDSTGNVRSTKGYSGVARGQTSGGGGMEALKAAADKQADNVNRGTGAATDLNAAAQTAIPSGGSGGAGGGPGSGKEDKGFGGNQDKGSKSVGESLDFLNKKARMEKDLELEYKKKELDDFGLLWGQMRNEGLKTFFGETVKAVTGVWTDGLKGALTPAGGVTQYACVNSEGAGEFVAKAAVTDNCGKDGASTKQWQPNGPGSFINCGNKRVVSKCKANGDEKDGDVKGDGKGNTVTDVNAMANSAGGTLLAAPAGNLGAACTKLDEFMAKAQGTDVATFAAALKPELAKLVSVRDALVEKTPGQGASSDCGSTALTLTGKSPIARQQSDIITNLGGTNTLSKMADASSDVGDVSSLSAQAQKAYEGIEASETDLKNVEGVLPKDPRIQIKMESFSMKEMSSGGLPHGVGAAIKSNFQPDAQIAATTMFKDIGEAYNSIVAQAEKFREVQDQLNLLNKGHVDLVRGDKSSVKKVVEDNNAYKNGISAHDDISDFTNKGPDVAPQGYTQKSPDALAKSDAAAVKIKTAAESLVAYATKKKEADSAGKEAENAAVGKKTVTETVATTPPAKLAEYTVLTEKVQKSAAAAEKAATTLPDETQKLAASNAATKAAEALTALGNAKADAQKKLEEANAALSEARKVQVGELNYLKKAIDDQGDKLMGKK